MTTASRVAFPFKAKTSAQNGGMGSVVSEAEIKAYQIRFRTALQGLNKALEKDWHKKNPSKACQYCRNARVNCVHIDGRMRCKACSYRHGRCSLRHDFEIETISGILKVSDAQCQRFYCAWRRIETAVARMSASPGPSDGSSDNAGEEPPKEAQRTCQTAFKGKACVTTTTTQPTERRDRYTRRYARQALSSPSASPVQGGVPEIDRFIASDYESPPPSSPTLLINSRNNPTSTRSCRSDRMVTGSSPSCPPAITSSAPELSTLHGRIEKLEEKLVIAKRNEEEVIQRYEKARGDLDKEVGAHDSALKLAHPKVCAENEALRSELFQWNDLKTRLSGANLDDILAFHARWSSIDLVAVMRRQQEQQAEAADADLMTNTPRNCQMGAELSGTQGENKRVGDRNEIASNHRAFVLSVSNLTNFLASRLPPISNPSHPDLIALARRLQETLNRLVLEDFAQSECGPSTFFVRGDGGPARELSLTFGVVRVVPLQFPLKRVLYALVNGVVWSD